MSDQFQDLIKLCDNAIQQYPDDLAILEKMIKVSQLCNDKIIEINDQKKALELGEKLKFNKSEISLIEFVHFANFAATETIACLDLSICLKGLLTKGLINSESIVEKKFYIKHSYLLIFEAIKNLNPSGKVPYAHQIIRKSSEKNRVEFDQFIETLNCFQKSDKFKKIKETRNNISGHIDKNLINYNKVNNELKYFEAILIIGEFHKIITPFLSIISNVTNLNAEALNNFMKKIKIEMEELDRQYRNYS